MIQLLGKTIEIVDSTNKSLIGLRGVVIDDTKDSLLLNTTRGEKRVVKHTITFTLDGETIAGNAISQKPQDRLKLKWKQK